MSCVALDPSQLDGYPRRGRTGLANTATDLSSALLEVARSTGTQRDLETLLRELVEVLPRCASFDRLSLVLHDPARAVMRLHSVVAAHPTRTTLRELPVPDSPAGVAWETQEPVVARDIDADPRFPIVTEILRGEGMKSYCAVPLRVVEREARVLVRDDAPDHGGHRAEERAELEVRHQGVVDLEEQAQPIALLRELALRRLGRLVVQHVVDRQRDLARERPQEGDDLPVEGVLFQAREHQRADPRFPIVTEILRGDDAVQPHHRARRIV